MKFELSNVIIALKLIKKDNGEVEEKFDDFLWKCVGKKGNIVLPDG